MIRVRLPQPTIEHAIIKSIRFFFVFLLCSTLVLGDSVGPTSGTATGAGWNSPANVGASDNAYAFRTIAGAVCGDGTEPCISLPLYISSLGFAIPAGSTVIGITATFEHKCSGTNACSTETPSGGKIQLTKTAGTGQGTNKGNAVFWGTSDSTETLGSSSDLWGSTWTTTEVNDPGFGLVIIAVNASSSNRTAFVDYMALTVTYTPSGSGSHRRVVISQTRSVQIHG